MSFFKNIFKKKEVIRKLTSVSEVLVKDMVILNDSFALPEVLRGKQFEVKEVTTYEYEDEKALEWALRGTDNTEIFLGLDEDDESHYAAADFIK